MWEFLAPYAHARGNIVPRAAAAQEATFLLSLLSAQPPPTPPPALLFPGGDLMELTNGLGAAAASSVLLRLRGALTHGFC